MARIHLEELVDSLSRGGKESSQAREFLTRTSAHIEPTLTRSLHSHSDETVRTLCATILGERRNPRSIPALLRALRDRSEQVREETLIAIERCARLQPGQLSAVLMLDRRNPRQVVSRVTAWWNIVRPELERGLPRRG